MEKTKNSLISAITMMTAEVVGVSKGGRYDLPVIRVYTDERSFSRIIEVELPFEEDHKIWPELEERSKR